MLVGDVGVQKEEILAEALKMVDSAKRNVQTASDSAAQLSFVLDLKITLPNTSEEVKPWTYLGQKEKMENMDQILEVYENSYGRVGLRYEGIRELLERMPITFVARNAKGKIFAFATFSTTNSGIRLGLAGATHGSELGLSVVELYTKLGNQQGWYGQVSGRPAQIAIHKGGGNIVPFKNAQRLMGKPKGAKFSSAQRNTKKVRKMNGFADSAIVKHAAEKKGMKPLELTFEDLVEEAVIQHEIPDTAEARDNCYAIVQHVNGKNQVMIKVMIGNPLEPRAR